MSSKLLILLPLMLTACTRKLQPRDIEVANCLCKQGGYLSALKIQPFDGPFAGIKFICLKDTNNTVFTHSDGTYVIECDDGGVK